MLKKISQKGFTLIELLVVIAIIGILAGIVMVSMNTTRQKARDVRRVSDMRQVALALELYYDDKGGYPADTTANDDDWGNSTTATTLVYELQTAPAYMAGVPSDPGSGSIAYVYYPSGAVANAAQDYVLRAQLENATNAALVGDVDGTVNGCDCADASRYYCLQP